MLSASSSSPMSASRASRGCGTRCRRGRRRGSAGRAPRGAPGRRPGAPGRRRSNRCRRRAPPRRRRPGRRPPTAYSRPRRSPRRACATALERLPGVPEQGHQASAPSRRPSVSSPSRRPRAPYRRGGVQRVRRWRAAFLLGARRATSSPRRRLGLLDLGEAGLRSPCACGRARARSLARPGWPAPKRAPSRVPVERAPGNQRAPWPANIRRPRTCPAPPAATREAPEQPRRVGLAVHRHQVVGQVRQQRHRHRPAASEGTGTALDGHRAGQHLRAVLVELTARLLALAWPPPVVGSVREAKPSTEARWAPGRTRAGSARPPSSSPRLVTTMVLPAPVSPVTAVKPGEARAARRR